MKQFSKNHKILIELILTNKCNKRCKYCDLDFKDKSLSFSDLDLFIKFLRNNNANYTINFFWGEPLLEYEKLVYFLDNSKKYVTSYSIGTNGLLLDEEKLNYFKNNNVKIYLSIDNITLGSGLDLPLIYKFKDIISINFVNDPDFLFNTLFIFNKILGYGFKDISFMPVFITKKWSVKKIINLKKIISEIKKHNFIKIYSYFNGVSIDKQFILDTDNFFYSDIDSLLWLQKQYKVLNNDIKKAINTETRLLSLIDTNTNLENLLKKYNIKELLNIILKIPNILGEGLNYKTIDIILKK